MSHKLPSKDKLAKQFSAMVEKAKATVASDIKDCTDEGIFEGSFEFKASRVASAVCAWLRDEGFWCTVEHNPDVSILKWGVFYNVTKKAQ